MSSRERKRSERRKRKARGEREAELLAQREERARRAEARNQAVRERLEPLERGERPAVVTAAAVISALLAIGTVLAYALGVEIAQFNEAGSETGTSRPAIFPTVASILVLGAMAYGLWRARYWAVLGFQTVLVLVLIVTVLALIQVTDVLRGLALLAVALIAGYLFYKMVKAMARIQMPQRR